MSCPFATPTAKIIARILVGLAMPATVLTLISGYQRPSNAALVSTSAQANMLTLADENDLRRRLLLRVEL